MAATAVAEKWNNQGPSDLPKGMRKEFLSFIKTIGTFKGDLSSFTAPPFILSTTSLVEYPSYWVEQPSRFVAPAREAHTAKRAVLVLTWFLTTLKQQYDHRADRKKGKPLNPVLGELFLGKFEDSTHGNDLGTTHVVSEQVSHHPPVTAYSIWNDTAGVSLTGHHISKTFFANRMIHLHKVGHVLLHIDAYNEDHLLTFPQVHLEGFLPPPPFPEFDANTPAYIVSSSGYTSKITFSGKGWLRGKRNSFVAILYADGEESTPLYTAEGQWTGQFTIRDASTDEVIETYDATTSHEKLTGMSVAPVEEQDPMESRRLWGKFTEAMYKRDMAGVSAEKNRIEVRQRDMRKEEENEGREWERRYFSRTSAVDPRVEALCKNVGIELEPELTGKSWQFDKAKYENAGTRRDNPFSDDKVVS